MSAMHWEARRRQKALDRRLASKIKQGAQGDGQKPSTMEQDQSDITVAPPALTGSSDPLVIDERILCPCQHAQKEQYSAKIENRYTSTQYSQQW